MAVITIERPEIARSFQAVAPEVSEFQADTGATWSFGDILKFNTATGKALKALAGDAVLLGIALSDNPYVTRTDVTKYPVELFTGDTVLFINTWVNNTITDVANAIALTNMGTYYDMAIAGSPHGAYFVLDFGHVADAILLIYELTGVAQYGVIGDYYVRVFAKIKASATYVGV